MCILFFGAFVYGIRRDESDGKEHFLIGYKLALQPYKQDITPAGHHRTLSKLNSNVCPPAKSLNISRGEKGGNAYVWLRIYMEFLLVDISGRYDDFVFFHDEGKTGFQDVLFWSPRH
jgi:hypothetical protein